MQNVSLRDLGTIDYLSAWNYQESLLQENVNIKLAYNKISAETSPAQAGFPVMDLPTINYLLLLEHPPVFTLGKSGSAENMLVSENTLDKKGIGFFKTNRGGDITFHGPGQLVGYPILDLEKFYTDIGRYLRELEEVIILTIAAYGLKGARSRGETGVWLDPDIPDKARKICAMGVRCSRWITMHGFALNVHTDLSYFDYIIPCGIMNKQVTSLQKELNIPVSMAEVKETFLLNFQEVFNVRLQPGMEPA